MDDQRSSLAMRLWFDGAVLLGRMFRLKHHDRNPEMPLSPYLINLRTREHPSRSGSLQEQTVEEIAAALLERIFARPRLAVGLSVYAGIPQAGEPFALAAEERMRRRHIERLILKKEEEGSGRRITGVLGPPRAKRGAALLLDDVVTMAESKIEAAEALIHHDIWVRGIAAVVDRQEGGRRILEENGYEVVTLFTSVELFGFYAEEKLISAGQHETIRRYIDLFRSEPEPIYE